MALKHMSDMERMLDKLAFEPMTGCWIYTGRLDRDGYGEFWVGSRSDGSRRNTRAHTFMYRTLIGPVPRELRLDHKCRLRCCANPQHLEPVTIRENTLRGVSPAALNAKKTHCKRGHEFTPDNTYIDRPRNGRMCKTCAKLLRKVG